MTYSTNILRIIEKLKHFVSSVSTKEKYRSSTSDFSRNSGKLDFQSYCLLGISLLKQSLSVEIYNLLTSNDLAVVSKSSYSDARYKILPAFYQDWNDLLLSLIYEQAEIIGTAEQIAAPLKDWRGYRLEVVDGSCLVLAQTKELGNFFGVHRNGTKKGRVIETVMSRVLLRVDLCNEYVLQSEVSRIDCSELTTFKTWLWQLNSNSITIMDRGFGCAAVFSFLNIHHKPFVCRLKVSFNNQVRAFIASAEVDQVVEFTINKTEKIVNQALKISEDDISADNSACYTEIKKGSIVKVRLVKVVLSTGEVEVLATNLMDSQAITVADLGNLYSKRWGIETIIDSLKNQLKMMVFSGLKPAAILQDIHATMFVYNLRQLFINHAQLIVEQEVTDKIVKKKEHNYEQKINKNVALGVLKPKIITIFLIHSPKEIVDELLAYFAKNKITTYPDKKSPKREKSLAKARNFKTHLNYKGAI